MKIKVHMLSFLSDNQVREVEVPPVVYVGTEEEKTEALLDSVFYYGQNNVQPVEGICSVSMGDVIELDDGRLFVVKGLGFGEINKEQFDAYKALDRRDRNFHFLTD